MTRAEVIDNIVQKLYSLIKEPPKEVLAIYETAKHFFGEENVDLQKNPILRSSIPWTRDSYSWLSLTDYINLPDSFYSKVPKYDEIGSSLADDPELYKEFMEILEQAPMTYIKQYAIIVKFDNITVTNEKNHSTTIEQIFALVSFRADGTVPNIKWMRTVFSEKHFRAGYRHSHLSGLDRGDKLTWGSPCLGSGPIVMTMNTLDTVCSIDMWSMLWLELDRCIRTESLAGGPYIELSSIDRFQLGGYATAYHGFNDPPGQVYRALWTSTVDVSPKDFLIELIKSNKIKFAFKGTSWEMKNTIGEFAVLASNIFLRILAEGISNYNQGHYDGTISSLFRSRLLVPATFNSAGSLLVHTDARVDELPEMTDPALVFKGENVYPQIIREHREGTLPYYTLLTPTILNYLKIQLETIANYYYERPTSTKSGKRRKA